MAKNRRHKKIDSITNNGILKLIIVTLLSEKYSPELISYYLSQLYPDELSMVVSHETIYLWIYKQKDKNGKYKFTLYLFTHRKKRQKRGNTYKNRAKDPSKKNIRERPSGAEDRSEPGHLEGDLIVSARNDAYLLTLVDRKYKNAWGVPVPSKDPELVSRAVIESLDNLPNGFVKSITFDNGTEFSPYKIIEEALSCGVFFADPYSAWQRGLNEHINSRIRQYIPKKKSFAFLTEEDFEYIFYSVNNRPRKSLGWNSPAELLNAYLN